MEDIVLWCTGLDVFVFGFWFSFSHSWAFLNKVAGDTKISCHVRVWDPRDGYMLELGRKSESLTMSKPSGSKSMPVLCASPP